MNLEHIKVSFIISVLNAEKTIENCLNSIINQNHKNFEIIIIDGKSEDNTIEIINKYIKHIEFFKSESDDGIYDAWNKALKRVTGDWLCFLGSDDFILGNGIVDMLSLLDTEGNINFISAKVMLVDEVGNDVQIVGRPWNFSSLKNKLGIIHCGALHSKSLFVNSKFNSDYKIAGDFEFLLKIGDKINALFLDKVIVKMYIGGLSRKQSNKVIYETYLALYQSDKFTLVQSIIYFLNAHLRVYIRALLVLCSQSTYNKIKLLFSRT